MKTETNLAVPSTSVARSAGLFYLLTILTGILAFYLGGRLIVSGDASSTAANILSHESLFRLGFLANSIMTVCYMVVTALFYELFRRVNKVISLVAALFRLFGCATLAASLLSYAAPLLVLQTVPGSFSTEQIHSLALLLLRSHGQAYDISLIFFGVYCVLIGLLILNSSFVPKIVGVLMAIADLGWLTYLWPPLAGGRVHS